MLLKHQCDFGILLGIQRVVAVGNGAAKILVEAGHDIQQRALSCPGWPG